MLPAFNEHGILPGGIHDCTLAEAEVRFGSFQQSDRRPRLWKEFREFFHQVKSCGFPRAVIIDGSFVTTTAAPNDIDLILVLPTNWNFQTDLPPDWYNLVSKKRVRQRFGFDILVAREDSEQYAEYMALFQRVRGQEHLRKGIVRIRL